MRLNIAAAAALAATVLTGSVLISTPAFASDLSKVGKAIQYPVQKMGENTSMAAHKALGHKSVEKDRQADARFAVKPNGTKIYKSPNSTMMAHRRHHRHHHHHHTM